jgi:hypothetical protein
MPNFIKTSSLWDVLSNQRASNLTVFAGLCISLFAVQFDVFTDVSVHVLASVVSLSAFVLTFNAPLGLLQFCTNPDLDVQPQVVMVADYPPPANSRTQSLLSTVATFLLWTAFDVLGIRVQLVDLLPISIKPADYSLLMRLAGGQRMLYEPFVQSMVEFIRNCGVNHIPVVVVGDTNARILRSVCVGNAFDHVTYAPHFCADQYRGWRGSKFMELLQAIYHAAKGTAIPEEVLALFPLRNLTFVRTILPHWSEEQVRELFRADPLLFMVGEDRLRRILGTPKFLAAYYLRHHSLLFLPTDEELEE